MATILGLPLGARQPDARITGTSYDAASTSDVNVTSYLAPALRHYRVISEAVRVISQNVATNGPQAFPADKNATTAYVDTPYDSTATDVELKLMQASVQIPDHSLRTLKAAGLNVATLTNAFLRDAIRAETERQLIRGDVGTNPLEFDGLESTGLPKQALPAVNTSFTTQLGSLDEMADLCRRGRGRSQCDMLVMTSAARRKVRRIMAQANRHWESIALPGLNMKIALADLAQGFTPIVVSDFIASTGSDTSIFGLVLEEENGCVLAESEGFRGVQFASVRDPASAQTIITAQQLTALLVQDSGKLVQLTGFNYV